jgi:FemAB-related protein (PEP-CTERM system-associated)
MPGVTRTDDRLLVEGCTEPEEWNAFLERNDGPAYAHWGWSEAVASYGHDRWHLVARDRETDDIVGALPLYHVESRLFGSRLLSPAFAERGSVTLADDGDTDSARQRLLERTQRIADERDVDSVSLRGSQVEGTDDFETKNRYVTFRADVERSTDAVRADAKNSRDRQIQQATENSALQFRVGTSLKDLREYYRLYLESMRGHGSPPHSFEFFRTLWEQLHDAGHLRLSMVTRDGSVINGMIDLSMGSTVYQWGVVTDYEYRDLNGGSWLLWKSLEWAAENGYAVYEFGRTREGSGVYMFKKSFGGSKTWYDDLHYFPGGEETLPDPEDKKFETARQVWRKLPLSVTRVVGPKIRKRIGM